MADQETLTKRNGPVASSSQVRGSGPGGQAPPDAEEQSTASTVVSNVTGFGENLLTLGELQTRLAAKEFVQNLQAAKNASALGLIGCVIAVGSVPIVLLGIAELLVSELAMKRGYALLSVAAAAIVLAGVAVAFAVSWLRGQRLGFPLSAEELTRNLNWIRTVLRQSGRFPRGR